VQAAAIQALAEEDRIRPWRSRTWRLGMGLFVSFSILNFAALALAPASILTPLESIQFVTNIVYNKLVNDTKVSPRMLLGVACAVCGTVLSVLFGASGDGCHTVAQLTGFWTDNVAWWIYLALTLALATIAFVVHEIYRRARLENRPAVLLPVAFTLYSALAGGAQMIVHSKVFSELLAIVMQGNTSMFTSWLLYVEVVLVTGCGILWAIKLTECLALYDPLLILPLMVGTYILFGGVAGGIFFREFATLEEGLAGAAGWPLYVTGMLLVLLGLALIAAASTDIDRREADGAEVAEASGRLVPLETIEEQVADDFRASRYEPRDSRTSAPDRASGLPMASVADGGADSGVKGDDGTEADVRTAPTRASPSLPQALVQQAREMGQSMSAGADQAKRALLQHREQARRVLRLERRRAFQAQRVLRHSASSAQMPSPWAMRRAAFELPQLRQGMRDALCIADQASELLMKTAQAGADAGLAAVGNVKGGLSQVVVGVGQAVQATGEGGTKQVKRIAHLSSVTKGVPSVVTV